MNKDRWKQLIISAVIAANDGDESILESLALHLEEVDKSKQGLRDKGYGCLGMGMLETVEQVK